MALIALAVVMALPAGCASQMTKLTASEQAAFGSRTFAAPLAATFAAARDALPRLGYTLANIDSRGGRITTARRPAGVRASIGIDGRSTTLLWLQYDLQLLIVDAAHTRVVATPHMYEGARDVSRDRSWILGGDEGLHAQWQALFKTIEAEL